MAFFQLTPSLVFTLFFSYSASSSCEDTVRELTEDDWTEMTQGQWMVKFYAPWCPACRSLTTVWEGLAKQIGNENYCVAKVDVTENPALSGRFFVTALPTIYHVKDGIFRQYRSARSQEDLADFAENSWKDTEPVPWYISPTSYHMAALGTFFQFSMTIRNLHTTMMTEYGIPVWGSYLIFAFATILIGLVIGLLIVCLCDMSRPQADHRPKTTSAAAAAASHSEDVSEDDDDSDVVDDINTAEDEQGDKSSTVRFREPQKSTE